MYDELILPAYIDPHPRSRQFEWSYRSRAGLVRPWVTTYSFGILGPSDLSQLPNLKDNRNRHQFTCVVEPHVDSGLMLSVDFEQEQSVVAGYAGAFFCINAVS